MHFIINRVQLIPMTLLLALSSLIQAAGQSVRLDSLKSVLQNNARQDSNKVITLNELAFQNYSYRVKDLNQYSRQALSLSQKIKYERGEAVAYKNIALSYMLLHGDVTALKYLNASLSIFSALKDTVNIAGVVNYIGCYYAAVKDYKRALPYFLESEKMLGDRASPIRYTIYSNTGSCYEDLKDYNKAAGYYRLIKQYAAKSNDYGWVLTSLYQTASLQMVRREFDNALVSASQALSIVNNTRISPRDAQMIYILMGDLSYHFKQYDQARKFYRLCAASASEVGSKENISAIYYKTHLLDSIAGNYKSALQNFKKYQLINDSLINQKKNEIIALYNIKYEVDQNEAETNRLIAENQTDDKVIFYQRLVIAIALLGLGVIIFALLRLKKLINRLQDLNDKIARQNAELEEVNGVKNKIFSVIAHDLRSPFSEFVGILELTEHQLISQEEMAGLLPSINRTVRRTMEMMDNLLIWSRNQMNGISLNPENVILSELFQDSIDKLESQIVKKKLTVTTNYTKNAAAWADPEMIRIVIRNLLSNAIKFTPEQGSIEIGSVVTDREAIFSIRDNGVGLSPSQLRQLFSLHIKSTSGTENETGTGLGLTICRDLIELNQGSIRAESQEGHGSIFYVSLPKQKI